MKQKKMLGHGNHWGALGFEDYSKTEPFLKKYVPISRTLGSFAAPWPKSPTKQLCQLEFGLGTVSIGSILGRDSDTEHWEILSAFPVLNCFEEWVVRTDRADNCYGAIEGCIEATASAGHTLKWFAPYFGFGAKAWKTKGFLRVKLSALALEISRYDAEPFVITDGPRIDELRAKLKSEGKIEESEREDLSITYQTDKLRTIFSDFYDHHEFIGRVVKARAIKPHPDLHGYILDLEVMPDPLVTGWKIPLYVFNSVLGDYKPKRGDLIKGYAWLQGQWARAAEATEKTAWQNQNMY